MFWLSGAGVTCTSTLTRSNTATLAGPSTETVLPKARDVKMKSQKANATVLKFLCLPFGIRTNPFLKNLKRAKSS